MADDDKLEVNLELPKLFGRKKKKAAEPEEPEPASDAPAPTDGTATTAEDAAEPVEPIGEEPVEAHAGAPTEADATDDMSDTAERAAITDEIVTETPAEPDVVQPTPGVEPHEQISDAPPATRMSEPEPEPVPQPPAPATEPEQDPEPAPESAPETKPVPKPDPSPEPPPDADPISQQAAPAAAEPPAAPKQKGPGVVTRMRASTGSLPRIALPKLPAIGGYQAAAITGAVIGLLLVLVTFGTMKACGFVRGTDTCGRGGFFLLAAIFVLMVIASTIVLRAWDIKEPGSTALLAVGMIAVVALLFLIDVLFSWWMVIAIPIVGAVSFALSFWVTDNYADEPVQRDEDINVT